MCTEYFLVVIEITSMCTFGSNLQGEEAWDLYRIWRLNDRGIFLKKIIFIIVDARNVINMLSVQ